MSGQKPKAKFTAGPVSAAIWENKVNAKSGKQVTLLKATVERRFKDKEGNWRSSGSFSRNEIPLAVYCLEESFEAMIKANKGEPIGKQEDNERSEDLF
jgi:hypothetical protein